MLTQACLRENATVWNLLYKFIGPFDCHCLFDTFDIPGKLPLPKKPGIFNKVVFFMRVVVVTIQEALKPVDNDGTGF